MGKIEYNTFTLRANALFAPLLRGTTMENSLGLYLHIPFCRSKCDYCDFYSLAGQDDRMDEYQRALIQQILEKSGCWS